MLGWNDKKLYKVCYYLTCCAENIAYKNRRPLPNIKVEIILKNGNINKFI